MKHDEWAQKELMGSFGHWATSGKPILGLRAFAHTVYGYVLVFGVHSLPSRGIYGKMIERFSAAWLQLRWGLRLVSSLQ